MSQAKMKDGKRWYCSFRYKDFSGKQKQVKKEGFKTKAEAKRFEQDFIAQHTGSTDMTFSALCELYLASYERRVKRSTYDNKRTVIMRHMIPFFGDMPISKISTLQVRRWQDHMLTVKPRRGESFCKSTLKQYETDLCVIFNYAKRYYGLAKNPVDHTERTKRERRNQKMQIWTASQFQQFLDAIGTEDDMSLVMFSTLFWTGMREGELLALTPEDFDFKAKTIRVGKTYYRRSGQDVISTPKTESSYRTVVMPDDLADMLKYFISRLACIKPQQRIFEPINAHALRYRLDRYTKKAGLVRIRVHDLRHSHASMLIELGCSPVLIAERLGHANPAITLQVYSHLYPNKQNEVAAMLQSYETVTQSES